LDSTWVEKGEPLSDQLPVVHRHQVTDTRLLVVDNRAAISTLGSESHDRERMPETTGTAEIDQPVAFLSMMPA
jgi:hypothetical protein